MQQASEYWDTSSCHSFCSTNERHFRDYDISDEELDFEADHPETACLPREPPRSQKVPQKREALTDAPSAEIEEGEIKDTSSIESCDDIHPCRFFEKGSCAFGEKCRFLHHSDKGLYSMFDRPRLATHNTYNRRRLPVMHEPPLPTVFSEEDISDWDRELEDAMLRVGVTRRKLPFVQLSLAVRKTKTLPTLENEKYTRRVRYRGKEEPRVTGLVSSKRKSTRSSETAGPESSKSYWNNKSRYSDTSRSRSRSLSVGRQFSCDCCRTPSPELGSRRSSSRRPICCYRRKSISKTSPPPVSKTRNDLRRKRRSRSRASSPDKTKIPQNVEAFETSSMRRSCTLSQSAKKRRDSKTHSSPKASKIKCSSDKNTLPTSHSSGEVYKLATSYSPDQRSSDMSISPLSSDCDYVNDPDVRFSSIRQASDMSISPFSDSLSPERFSTPVWGADEPTSGIAASNLAPDPRKMPKSEVHIPRKRFKSDVAEVNPHIFLSQVPISKSSSPRKRFRKEVAVPKPSAIPRKVPESIGFDLKKGFKRNVAEPKTSAMVLEIPKSLGSNSKKKLKNNVAQPKPLVVLREVPKCIDSDLKKRLKSDVAELRPSGVMREAPKYIDSDLKKGLKSDDAELRPSSVLREAPKCIDSDLKKVLKSDVAELRPSAIPQEIPKPDRSNPKIKLENNVSELKREIPKPESSAPPKRFNHLLFDLMKYHKKDSSTEVAVSAEAAHSLEHRDMSATKVGQKSAIHRSVLSKKELLIKRLQNIDAAIKKKKAHEKQNP